MILGIETSCDETAAALVSDDGTIVSNVVASQADLHAKYGGVVPEIASRRHLDLIVPVLEEALTEEPTAIAVTVRPGLIGALLVGVSAAKALAWARRLPLIPVDHLHGHVASLFLDPEPLEPPFLCLLASGGHTLLLDVQDHVRFSVLGQSLDDAAGEAFDKGARLLGLGYPGGPAIERAAAGGDPTAVPLPVAMAGRDGLDLSFSGLKTALRTRLADGAFAPADLAASYQAAIVASLVTRTRRALEQTGARRLGVVGGVAANTSLRGALDALCADCGIELRCAPLALCGDNAAMIGAAGEHLEFVEFPDYLAIDAHPRSAVMAN